MIPIVTDEEGAKITMSREEMAEAGIEIFKTYDKQWHNERLDTLREALHEYEEEKMEVGRKKYGDSWSVCDPLYLYRRMEEEFYEFRQAVEHDRDTDAAVAELADFVNFALTYMVRMEVESW